MRVLLSGCGGHMGAAVASVLAERGDAVSAGVDLRPPAGAAFPVHGSFREVTEPADVLIDFSAPALLGDLLDYAVSHNLPAVLATTGYTETDVARIHAASERIPVFFSSNLSLGINLLAELAKTAARVLGPGFDIEIIEKHHNRKKDAPSGTALMLADAVRGEKHYVFDRTARRAPRDPDEIGIHSVRGGTIVGEHEILFAGKDETVTLSHGAASKTVFAVGAANAARFLSGKTPGLYTMRDLVAG